MPFNTDSFLTLICVEALKLYLHMRFSKLNYVKPIYTLILSLMSFNILHLTVDCVFMQLQQ